MLENRGTGGNGALNVTKSSTRFDRSNQHGGDPLPVWWIVHRHDPRGHPVYWVGPAGAAADAGPGTDFAAIAAGKVSITPIRVDLTHYEVFDQLAAWVHHL